MDRQTNIIVDNAGNKLQTVKLESSAGTNSMGGGHTCYINGDLPSALQEDRKWTKVILPAVMHQTCLVLWTWRKLANETNAKNAPKIC